MLLSAKVRLRSIALKGLSRGALRDLAILQAKQQIASLKFATAQEQCLFAKAILGAATEVIKGAFSK